MNAGERNRSEGQCAVAPQVNYTVLKERECRFNVNGVVRNPFSIMRLLFVFLLLILHLKIKKGQTKIINDVFCLATFIL